MTGVTEIAVAHRPRSLGARVWSAVVAAWGAVTGVAPHVLHHVGPLAGAAILAGAAGRLLFFSIGLVAAVPMLLRLRRRFRTWVARAGSCVRGACARRRRRTTTTGRSGSRS